MHVAIIAVYTYNIPVRTYIATFQSGIHSYVYMYLHICNKI